MSFMITRDNYEEFFLLYVDNELSAAERQAVERWVADNPDLKEEWDILSQCRMRPDDHLVFTGSEVLLKQEGALTEDNYEKYFLSYVDGELDEVTRRSVDEFVRRHASLRRELERLQQTVSTPDPAVVFANKEVLYKKEDTRRIMPLPWRIAAAAIVAGVIGLLIFNPLRKVPPEGRLSSVTGNKTGQHKPGARPAVKDTTATNENDVRKNDVVINEKKDPPGVTPVPAAALHLSEAGQAGRMAEVDKAEVNKKGRMPRNAQTNTGIPGIPIGTEKDGKEQQDDPGNGEWAQTDPLINKRVIRQAPVRVVAAGPINRHNRMIVLTGLADSGDPAPESEANSSFATRAMLASSDGNPEDGFTMESSSPKKNKLRGLFRKVTRVLEKNTNRDEEDKHTVLIGGFQFALK